MRLLAAPVLAVDGARGHLFPLATMALGGGIALWFGWPGSVGGTLVLVALGAALAFGAGALFGPVPARATLLLAAAFATGFVAAEYRAQAVVAPVLGFHYYGPIEGRIVHVDRSGSDKPRLLLDRVILRDVTPERTPLHVRVSLHGSDGWLAPEPGQTVILTGHLDPPPPLAGPGAFDFPRMAFFNRLGAVGYTRMPVLLLEPAAGMDQWIGRLRTRLATAVRAHVPGQPGAFGAGMTTGDRSEISQDTVAALRDSSLAHILAISGLHMSLMTAFVFGLIRGGIACIPPLALRINAKKTAALLSLGVAAFYLLLSGASVSTERAFVMISVMLVAILIDRRAISLRSLAIAAAILLVFRPENLFAPGFQMSFAAAIALVAGFRALERRLNPQRWQRWQIEAFTLLTSSIIGTFATAPFAAAQFHRFADYGVLANVLAVPVVGVMIIPMAVLAVLMAPVGLSALPLWVLGKGAAWILFIAHWTAGLGGAITGIAVPAPGVIAVMACGGLWLVYWPGRARLVGLPLMIGALLFWSAVPRPDLLISVRGDLVGLLGPEGRSLSVGTRNGFTASNWLEADGDLVTKEEAAARPGFDGPKAARNFTIADLRGVSLSGTSALPALSPACDAHDLVVIAARVEDDDRPAGDCLVIDQRLLARTGAIALYRDGEHGLRLDPVRGHSRPWATVDNEALAMVQRELDARTLGRAAFSE